LDCGNDQIGAYRRTHHDEYVVAIHNLRDAPAPTLVDANSRRTSTDLLSGKAYESKRKSLHLKMAPYQ
jgi:hypothetical protein